MGLSTALVVGASGATGKYVVHLLLEKGHNVKVVVSDRKAMINSLESLSGATSESYGDRLAVTEASLLDLTDDQMKEHVQGCDAVVSCLGHNITLRGMYGHPRRLVTEATTRLCEAIGTSNKETKFILMGTEGAANPNGQDDVRVLSERVVLSLLRYLLPPHADNEGAAAYLHSLGSSGVEWAVVRPTNLIDGEVTSYTLFDKPQGSLFGAGTVRRSNVAKYMVDLILDEGSWEEWKFKMPVINDAATDADADAVADAVAEKK